MKNVVLRRKFKVPIFEAAVYVIVAHEPHLALARSRHFPCSNNDGTFLGCCIANAEHGQFGLFFRYFGLNENVVAHEVDHLRDEIEKWLGERNKAHEYRAHLLGWLQARVRSLLVKNKIEIASK